MGVNFLGIILRGDGPGPMGVNQSIGAQTPDYFNKELSMDRLGGNFDGLNRVQGLPFSEASGQSRGCETQLLQLLRRTDAGGVAGSTAVGDVLLIGQTVLS